MPVFRLLGGRKIHVGAGCTHARGEGRFGTRQRLNFSWTTCHPYTQFICAHLRLHHHSRRHTELKPHLKLTRFICEQISLVYSIKALRHTRPVTCDMVRAVTVTALAISHVTGLV